MINLLLAPGEYSHMETQGQEQRAWQLSIGGPYLLRRMTSLHPLVHSPSTPLHVHFLWEADALVLGPIYPGICDTYKTMIISW